MRELPQNHLTLEQGSILSELIMAMGWDTKCARFDDIQATKRLDDIATFKIMVCQLKI